MNAFLGMFFRKFDPRAEFFNPGIRMIYDSGLMDYFFDMTIPYEDMKLYVKVKEEPLIMEHFYVPTIIFTVGLILNCVAFALEFRAGKKEEAQKEEFHWVTFCAKN